MGRWGRYLTYYRSIVCALAAVSVLCLPGPASADGPDAGAEPPEQPDLLPTSLPTGEEWPAEPPPRAPSGRPPWPLLPAFGKEGLIDYLDMELLEDFRHRLGLHSRLYDRVGVSGQDARLGMAQYDAGYRLCWDFGPVLTARMHAMDLDTHAVLPDTGERLGPQLWDVQAGFNLPLLIVPPGVYNVTIGSAGDRLFASDDEITADVTYYIGDPGVKNGFLFLVNYNNNRDWLNRVIFPGFMFRFQSKDEREKLVVGFPFCGGRWEPTRRLSLAATYSFPRTVRARAAYRPIRPVELFASFDFDSHRYFRHDRRRTKDRLWYVEKRLAAGVRWEISKHAFVEVSGGYAFDRLFFEGETYEDRHFNRLDLADGAFAGVQLGIRF